MPKDIGSLVQGYQEFRKKYFNGKSPIFEDLVRLGQRPKVLIIACSDSRVDPAIVLDCQPGDLFVVRNVANLVPPYQIDNSYHGISAALEFAVSSLKVHHVIVFGHSQCGGIQSLVENPDNSHPCYSFVAKWMELARPACERTYQNHPHTTLDEKIQICGHYALIQSLNNLMTFPWIASSVQEGTLCIHGWFFNLSTGIIDAYNIDTENFEELGILRN